MAKRTGKQKKHEKEKEKVQKKELERLSEPWISQRSGLQVMGLLSLVLAVFMTWQLYPTEGPLRALMWGLAAGASIWVVFGLSFAFNKLVRRR